VKLTAVAQAVSAAAERLNIAVSAQEKRMVAGVATSPMVLAYEIGQWILRVNRLDPVAVTDGTGVLGELFLDFFKTKTDDTVLADTVAKEFHKALRDEAGLSDVQVMDFFKALQDAAGASESQSFGLGKQFIEEKVVLDQAIFEFQKALQEASTVSDTPALALSKQKADSLATSDAVIQAFNKVLAEPLNLLDQASFDLQRILVESLGVSSHEVMVFFKVLTDGFGVQDALTTKVGKSASDATSLADLHRLNIVRMFQDTVWSTDDLDGEASIVDEQTLAFVKARTDLLAVSDFIYLLKKATRVFMNLVGATDSKKIGFLKKTFDDGTVFDLLKSHPTKALTDFSAVDDQSIVFVTDKILTEATIPVDQMALAISKPGIIDAFGTTDFPILGTSLVKTESASLTDSGSLRSQGYTNDFSYFAEDYVGVSKTF